MTTPVPPTPPATPPPPPPRVDPQALRIVLFGMPDAGKSSLLGALAQAAQTQERSLRGRLTDPSHGLAELQQRVYDERPRETLEEIVPYPVAYEPFVGQKPDPSQHLDAVLYDCDGRVANEILTRQRDLSDTRGGLVGAVLRADALVLVVDAAAPPEQIDNDFHEFIRFLRFLERHRGQRSEVAGLPVYLVLTKCDLLRKPGEPMSVWNDRVAERKRQVHARFKDFLEKEEAAAGFGSINLEVATTAVRQPAATGPATREPLGVAELFRNTLIAARNYRDRVRRSQRRLALLVLGAVVLLGGLTAGAAGLYYAHDQARPNPVAIAVEGYRAREGATAAERLGEPLQRKISELSGYQQSPDFEKLPQELKDFTNTRLLELTAYRKFRDQLFGVRPPSDLRSLAELAELEAQLRERYGPPAEHADEWRSTDAVLLRERWLGDIAAVRAAATALENWYSELRAEAARLLYLSDRPGERVALPWAVWHEQLNKLLIQAEAPPHRPTDRLPGPAGSPSAKQPLTYEAVYALAEVAAVRKEWEADRDRLLTLRDITQALGLVPEAADRRGVLKVPELPSADDVRDRVAALRRQYPRAGEWAVAKLPDAVAPDIRAAAQASYDRLVKSGQGVVLAALKRNAADGRETHAAWLAVADWLPDAAELRDWRELANALQRLMTPQPEDPVAALAAFLRERSFTLKFAGLRLTLPDDAAGSRLRPTGKLAVYLNSDTPALTFALRGEGNRDPLRRVTVYTFAPEAGDRLTFAPGQQLWADLALRDADGKDWKLSWLQCRSTHVYSFERLVRTPRLHRAADDPLTGALPRDLALAVTPETGVPKVPDLLPVVPPRIQ